MTTEIQATYERDSKRYHKYVIDSGQEAVGTLYISKDVEAVPKELVVKLKVKEYKAEKK